MLVAKLLLTLLLLLTTAGRVCQRLQELVESRAANLNLRHLRCLLCLLQPQPSQLAPAGCGRETQEHVRLCWWWVNQNHRQPEASY